jgi:hypothetical protein
MALPGTVAAMRVRHACPGSSVMDKQESKWTYLSGWASIAVIILVMYAASKYFGF